MLSLKNVTIETKNGQTLLNNVSLDVKKGDLIVLSGCEENREALLSVLGGLEVVTKGEVYVDDIEISKFSATQNVKLRREKFAYFLKSSIIDECLTVRENVELPLLFAGVESKLIEESVTRAVQIVGMGDFIDVKASELTVWQKNKLGIAVLLAKNPEIMIISEPLRVVDMKKIKEITGLVQALNKEGITIIMSSDVDEIKQCAKRKIEVSSDGVIVEVKKERAPRKTSEEKPKTKRTRKPKVKEEVKETQEKEVEKVKIEPVPEEDVKPVKSRKPRTKKVD